MTLSLASRQSQNEGNELRIGKLAFRRREVWYAEDEPSGPAPIRPHVVQGRSCDPRLGRRVIRDVCPPFESARAGFGDPVVGESLITSDDQERPIDVILRCGEEALEGFAPAFALHHRCITPEAATPFTSLLKS